MVTRQRPHEHARHLRNGKVVPVNRGIVSKNTNFPQITILAKRWFDKMYGNTYHSVDVYVDGKHIGREPFTYGYDDQYKETAFKILQNAGYYPKTDDKDDYYPFMMDMRSHRDKFIINVVDVGRKKDL